MFLCVLSLTQLSDMEAGSQSLPALEYTAEFFAPLDYHDIKERCLSMIWKGHIEQVLYCDRRVTALQLDS